MSLVDNEKYRIKYLKYKTKYLKLKEQQGQGPILAKGYICPLWKYFFCFDDLSKQLSPKQQLPTKYDKFKALANYVSFLLIDESLGITTLALVTSYNRLGLSIAGGTLGKITVEKGKYIRENFEGILGNKGTLVSYSKNKKYYKIPAKMSLVNINLDDPVLINNINELIKQSLFTTVGNKTVPKIISIYSFFGDDLQHKYTVDYEGESLTVSKITPDESTLNTHTISKHPGINFKSVDDISISNLF